MLRMTSAALRASARFLAAKSRHNIHQSCVRPHRHFSSTSGSTSSNLELEQIPSDKLKKLNKTSAMLYRLLLKECRAVGRRQSAVRSTVDDGDDGSASSATNQWLTGRLLLQPPLDTADLGRFRELDDVVTSGFDGENNNTSNDDDGNDHINAGENEDEDTTVWKIIEFFHRHSSDKTSLGAALKFGMIPGLTEHLLPYHGTTNPHQFHLVTPEQLVHAVRSSFLRCADEEMDDALQESIRAHLTKDDVVTLHRRAIEAVPLLHEQIHLTDCTSVGINEERGVRVLATSAFKGRGFRHRQEEHAFVYRIRVENIGKSSSSCDGENKAKKEEEDGSSSRNPIFQLLGRMWLIAERSSPPSAQENVKIDEQEPQKVIAPDTGVVGYHPVLFPKGSIEYYSGCNLQSSSGNMRGAYFMVELKEDEDDCRTVRVGDKLAAFDLAEEDERRFAVPVEPFPLLVR